MARDEFYKNKNASFSLQNIFDINYRHTATAKTQAPEQSVERPNVDILRKLKKKIASDDVE